MELGESKAHKTPTTDKRKSDSARKDNATSEDSDSNKKDTIMIKNPALDHQADNASTHETPMISNTGAPIVGNAVDPSHFPSQLYKMLEEIDSNSGAAAEQIEGKAFSSLVSWQPHGKCLLIHDEDMFSKHVLTRYFCRLKFTSFQRQLHFHGFKRLCKQGKPSINELHCCSLPEIAYP
jgi:hypothetical protein